MKVLVACEFSGRVRDAFIEQGHNAYSCDLIPNQGFHGHKHLMRDVRPLLKLKWDLVIAHPPCTYLCNSGVHHLVNDRTGRRYQEMLDACLFFLDCLDANAPRVCVENPIMHKHAKQFIPDRVSQVIQPWQFGHYETKATCLWLKNLPHLAPTGIVGDRSDGSRKPRIYMMSSSKGESRKRLRSVTPAGVAHAMATQWGSL